MGKIVRVQITDAQIRISVFIRPFSLKDSLFQFTCKKSLLPPFHYCILHGRGYSSGYDSLKNNASLPSDPSCSLSTGTKRSSTLLPTFKTAFSPTFTAIHRHASEMEHYGNMMCS